MTATELIRRAKAGDGQAFAEIVETYHADVFRIASYGLGDPAATDDLVQQVFLSVYRFLDRFVITQDFGAWIRSIARNAVRQELRQKIRRERRLAEYRTWAVQRLSDEAFEECDRALRDALAICRKDLPELSEAAIRLHYEESLSYDDLATALGKTTGAVRQLLARARESLRRCVEQRSSQREDQP